MNPTLLALRAITAILFQQLLKPILWIVSLIVAIVLGIDIYLGGWVNAWWFVFLVVIVPVGIVVAVLAVFLWHLSTLLLPRPLKREECAQLITFSQKILHLAEVRSMPVPLLAFMVAKDILRRRKSSYLENLVHDSLSLRDDFSAIRRLFDRK